MVLDTLMEASKRNANWNAMMKKTMNEEKTYAGNHHLVAAIGTGNSIAKWSSC